MVSFPLNLDRDPRRGSPTRPRSPLRSSPLPTSFPRPAGGALGGLARVLVISASLVPALLISALLTSALPSGASAQEVSLAPGTPAPDAELQDLDGNPVRLLDYVEEGKPTLLEFWASWCENCEALQPQLNRIRQRWEGELNMVAIAVAVSQSQRRVRRHVEEHDPGYPYLWDHRGNAVRAYNAATTSIVVILDREGRVAYTGVGGDQELVPVLEGLLEG